MERTRAPRRARGFTLLEIIVTITLAGLVGALLVSMLGTTLLNSGDAKVTAMESARAEAALESVVAVYVGHVNANTSGTLAAVQAHFVTNPNPALTFANVTIGGIPALQVTATVGSSSVTTVLTQARTNALDSAMKY